MYNFMSDKRFDIATSKANEVLKRIKNKEGIISTSEIIEIVEDLTEKSVSIMETDFSRLSEEAEKFGAMMSVTDKNAKIVLNSSSKIDLEFKRFSLVHELGHLITEKYTVADSENKFTLSSHINFNLNRIEEKDYNENGILLNEEIANVFALKVLIPFDILIEKINSGTHNFKEIAKYFGVSEEAIRSRLMLGA